MKKLLRSTYTLLKNGLFSLFILKDWLHFKRLDNETRFSNSITSFYPQVFDKTFETGFDRHYLYHTAWAVRRVIEFAPAYHIDISSSLYFCVTLSATIPVRFYDYRPAQIQLSSLQTDKADLCSLFFEDNSISSLSCMHTMEHIGLGRYGDPIDPNGDMIAARELSRVLAPGGQLLMVLPVGENAVIEFNAHRIYTYDQVINLFPTLQLKEFSFVSEYGNDGIQYNAEPTSLVNEQYACGLFVFVKP